MLRKFFVIAACAVILLTGVFSCAPPGSEQYYTLTTHMSGGSGTLTVTPDRSEYLAGTTVTLTAVPDSAYLFSYWTGDFTGTSNSTFVTINHDMDITAVLTPETNTYLIDNVGPGSKAFEIDGSPADALDLTINLGVSSHDIYLVFTNVSAAAGNAPEVNFSSIAPVSQGGWFSRSAALSSLPASGIQMSTPEIMEYNRNFKDRLVRDFTDDGPAKSEFNASVQAPADSEGKTGLFIYDDKGHTVPATCRSVTSDGNKVLNIWVADDCWTGGTKADLTDQMVNALAEKFLDPANGDEDIYNWVTNIYGEEWGQTQYTNLIDDNDEITILLMDIEQSGVVGFFWSKDNLHKSGAGSEPLSNERIMFYIDAPIYATSDGGTWDATDYWPETVYSTLAHEFQHMIHFYQKTILESGGAGTDTWINEMCSEVTEDFVARKLQVSGPRGIAWNDPTDGGATGVTNGRIPYFNLYNDVSLTEWPDEDASQSLILGHYGISYGFGAYLARNFGGVDFFRSIVHNDKTDFNAITSALAENGYSAETFESVLTKWGAAVLLSDDTNAAPEYRYNTGDWMDSEINEETYSLGSINLFNYSSLPNTYTTLPGGLVTQEGGSTLYYEYGTGLTGTLNADVSYGPNTRLTVVIK